MIDLSRKLIHKIKEKTPDEVTAVDFFTGVLPMKKEAAYRRLRNEIPLTLNEAAQISLNLNISLDELIKYKDDDIYKMSMEKMEGENLFKGYEKNMQQTIGALKHVQSDPEAVLYIATNKLIFPLAFNYPTISKFRLYISDYQLRMEVKPKKMADFIIPNHIRELEKEYIVIAQKYPTHYVWTRDYFSSFVIEVQYFSETGLLSKEEFNLLKDEAHDMLNTLERAIITGKPDNGAPLFAYLSTIHIDNNYVYVKSSQFEACAINIFGINHLSCVEPALCKDVKNWIQSLMKYSVLISQAGLIERTDFIKRQRKILKKLD